MAPVPVKIVEKEKECEHITTFTLEPEEPLGLPKPGQFYMVWIPGMDEKPMGASGIAPLKISVNAIGPFSDALSKMRVGQRMWLSGPYGNGFPVEGKKSVLVVGGGCGFAPLRSVLEYAKINGITAKAILGARSINGLMTVPACGYRVCTDDGSRGTKGFVTAELEKALASEKFDAVYCCGPEKMMKAVAEMCIAKKQDCWLLLERYMKCGIGICGQCAIGGKLVCKDGPAFPAGIIKEPEFGKCGRDSAGRKKPI